MKLVAAMPVRNESWILGLSARAALMWVDELIILDHCSTDGSREMALQIQSEYGIERVRLLFEDAPVWEEMRHRQRLLDAARDRGATHIALVDADEVLSGNLLSSIRSIIARIPAGATMQLPWQCLRGSIDKTHADGVWGVADVSAAFLDEPCCHWKARDGYDFHHRQPMGRPFVPFLPVPRSDGGLMHLQFVSERRLRAKQYLYQLTERLRWPGREPVSVVRARYSRAVYEYSGMSQVPAAWWAPYESLLQYLHVDAEPWQLAACSELLDEHPELVCGLDGFGLKV